MYCTNRSEVGGNIGLSASAIVGMLSFAADKSGTSSADIRCICRSGRRDGSGKTFRKRTSIDLYPGDHSMTLRCCFSESGLIDKVSSSTSGPGRCRSRVNQDY